MTMTKEQLLNLADHLKGDERYRFMGEHFGYPECCIQLFLNRSGHWWFNELPWYPTRTLKLDGYVPCGKCAKLPRQQLVNDINSRRKIEKIK